MRILPIAVAATMTIMLAPLVAPAPSAAAESRCALKGSRTIAATQYARVFRTRFVEDDARVYGCLYSSGRRRLLAEFADEIYVADIRLSGRFVALTRGYSGRMGQAFTIVVTDLRTGASRDTLHVDPTGQPDNTARVEDLELRKNGSVAWMALYRESREREPERFVGKADAEGRAELARGLDIEPGSLALAGTTLYWTQGGGARSAQLR